MKLMGDELVWSDTTVGGCLIHYGELSKPINLPNGRKVYERFAFGAFTDSVAAINAGQVIKANIDHEGDSSMLTLGATGNNIVLEAKSDGVYMTMTWLDDTVSQDLAKRVKGNLVTGLSIEFQAPPGMEPSYSTTPSGDYIRTFSRANLVGFAVTKDPMFVGSQIMMRSIDKVELDVIASEVDKIHLAARTKFWNYVNELTNTFKP
jgi:HK97 family phage prohead protease